MTNEEKAKFVRYVKNRHTWLSVSAKRDLGHMNNAEGMLPSNVNKLTSKQATAIMREIERCDLTFIDEEKADTDEHWLQHFFS